MLSVSKTMHFVLQIVLSYFVQLVLPNLAQRELSLGILRHKDLDGSVVLM